LDLVSLSASKATESVVFAAKRRGMPLHVWTVNDSLTMSELIDRGVTGIITDRPALLVRTLEARREMSEVQRLLLRTGHRPWDELLEDEDEDDGGTKPEGE
jgi:glycerophosphoryl diester phosphodiesterase